VLGFMVILCSWCNSHMSLMSGIANFGLLLEECCSETC
jgi:hypothetical protein